MVVMSIAPGGTISVATRDFDQVYVVVDGEGAALIDSEIMALTSGIRLAVSAGLSLAIANPGPAPASLVCFS
jgi:mannose-6-phosphate isomerase-like protein (cupin superfamily)